MMCQYADGCVRQAADNEFDLCPTHLEELADRLIDEDQINRFERDMENKSRREYPQYYDGTGRW